MIMKNYFIIISYVVSLFFSCQKNKDEKNQTGKLDAEKNKYQIQATKKDFEIAKVLKGAISASTKIELRSEKRIKISKILVKNNEPVKKGQTLVEVDKTEIEKKKIELQDKIKQLEIDIKAASDQLELSERQIGRKKKLLAQGIVAQKDVEEVETQYNFAVTQKKTKDLELTKAKREFDETNSQVSTSDFIAPIDGVVSSLVQPDPNSQNEVNGGQVVANVSDLSNLSLYISVDETLVSKIKTNDSLEITIDALSQKKCTGIVKEVALTAANKNQQNSWEQQQSQSTMLGYSIKIDLDKQCSGDGDHALKEGFEASAKYVFDKKENALVIPLACVSTTPEGDFILVSNQQNTPPKMTAVKTGIRSDLEIEILEGVQPNDWIYIQ